MITDAELAAALEGRDHWRAIEQDAAVYEPPGVPAHVRVGRIAALLARVRAVTTGTTRR